MSTPVSDPTGYYLDPRTYDAVYADVTADLAPHVALMTSAGGRALEVCCGNGRLLVPTLAAGIACDGLDLDPVMLADLRRKLSERGLSTLVYEADMRDFSLPRRYALVAIPFNSFLHNLTQEDQLATLRRCLHHLEPGGRLVLAIFHPSAAKLIEWSGEEKLVRELPWGAGSLRIWDRAEDDRVEQVRRMKRRVEFFDAAGARVDEQRMAFDMRYVYKPEMELLLRVAGFTRWEVRPAFGDYRDPASAPGARPAVEGDNLSWTAWKDAR